MDEIFDLPAHPLLVHAPIVLAPLLLLALVAAASRVSWRDRLGFVPACGVLVLSVSMFLARNSGEAFRDSLDESGSLDPKQVSRHAELGDQTFILTLALLVTAGMGVALTWSRDRAATNGSPDSTRGAIPDWAGPFLSWLAVVVSVFVVVWTVRTGHEGAKVVWEGVGD